MALTEGSEQFKARGQKGALGILRGCDPTGLAASAVKLLAVGLLLGGLALVSIALLTEGIENRNYWLEQTYTVEELEEIHGGRDSEISP